jgi:O-methyltransferase
MYFMFQRMFRKTSTPAKPDTPAVVEPVEPGIDKERISGGPTYSEDCLRVWGQSTDFMTDPKFLDAYDTGMSTGHHIMRPEGSKEDIGIHWRIVTCCWAATHAMQLDGDFVECGVNTGIMSSAVCKYLEFNKTGRSFWLFDTFEGIPDDQISPSERAGGRGDENFFYTGVWRHAQETFAPYPKAHLVRGRVPDTLKIGSD